MRIERHDLHGTGEQDCEVYDMPPNPDYWAAVSDVPCPVEGCDQTVVWYEAGYVPGHRVCMTRAKDEDGYLVESIQHRFFARGDSEHPVLVRDPR